MWSSTERSGLEIEIWGKLVFKLMRVDRMQCKIKNDGSNV